MIVTFSWTSEGQCECKHVNILCSTVHLADCFWIVLHTPYRLSELMCPSDSHLPQKEGTHWVIYKYIGPDLSTVNY